ncbi:hypothetical protein CHH57_01965 [Niallia circulans]|uniref:Uncharacterized protein n=1 Tax=Niallia circulans TaxID=1397 RepID=A0AA91TW59_NIACI|nr:hypothetical protein [Niallia circulans]PAD84964.1 hypothetical protein CHH57_01965 [Niallia circulans]
MKSADVDLTQGDFGEWVIRGNSNGNIKLTQKNIDFLYNLIKELKSKKNEALRGGRVNVS